LNSRRLLLQKIYFSNKEKYTLLFTNDWHYTMKST
jgi:hypothetical protein